MTLRRQVTLQRRGSSTSVFGDANGTWVDVSNLGATIEVLNNSESISGDREFNESVLRFTFPRGSISSTITTDDRIIFQSTPYEVQSVNSVSIRGNQVVVVGENNGIS